MVTATSEVINTSIPTLEEQHYYMFTKVFNNENVSEAIAFILRRNLMPKKPSAMRMIINSPGGYVTSMFSLVDIMACSRIPIYTYGLGSISSCGLLTFIAGKKDHRYITKNTAILSHQFFSFTMGKEHELIAAAKEHNLVSERITAHYKKCTGLSDKDIKKYLLPPEDVWLTAKEAVKFGLADQIIESL
jgi:ATP-dependent Clp protease, protease subunit